MVGSGVAHIILPELHSVCCHIFEPQDIAMLASLTSRVNDVCINGCILLLLSAINPPRAHHFAIFLTFDLPCASFKTDLELFKATKHMEFWTKDMWILPIYRPGHWVLCIADFTRCELQLFDSLAEEKPWQSNVNVHSPRCLFYRLLLTLRERKL